jgi:hypothetical protein
MDVLAFVVILVLLTMFVARPLYRSVGSPDAQDR